MKNYFLLLLLLIATQTFAQKKGKVDPKAVQIDSLTKASTAFSAQADSLLIVSDSLSKERTIYYGLYTTIKEKVLKRDFDPAKLSFIIDSLARGRDSTYQVLNVSSSALMDSLNVLKIENAEMKTMINSMTEVEAAKNRLVNELRLLKELLDSKILTQAEFDSRKATVLAKWQ